MLRRNFRPGCGSSDISRPGKKTRSRTRCAAIQLFRVRVYSHRAEPQSNYYDQILQRYKNTMRGGSTDTVIRCAPPPASVRVARNGCLVQDQFEIAYSNYSVQTAANAVGVALIVRVADNFF